MALLRRKRRGADGDIPVASFSDLAFLLIIFFILTTTLEQPVGMKTELPSGEKGQPTQEQKTNIVNLHDGKISFNDQLTDLDRLRRNLKLLQLDQKQADQKIILLEATGAVPYQMYYQVMHAISTAGGVVGIVREEGK